MPALETLAVIAYKQPVTAPEISDIRGVNTSGVISTLLDKRLITTAGRKEVIGRPILYKTSKEFLMRFGLCDLDELPSLKEFEALAREALGADEGVLPSTDETVLRDSSASSQKNHSTAGPSAGLAPLEQKLAEAEALREEEVTATGEGMPSGELDEDPPKPSAKSTSAGE